MKEATELVDICIEHGMNFFDTADIYSSGLAEEILGKAVGERRNDVLISTKATFSMGEGPNECGSVEETLAALDNLISSGKVRYIGASNFSGWHLMKSLAASEKFGLARYVAYQGYYSLVGRDCEWELMPLGLDQGVGLMVWSPLGWGRLTGKITRNNPPKEGRIAQGGAEGGPPVDDEYLFTVVDALQDVADEVGKTIPQVALNWLLQRPTVSNVVVGARNADQLKQNLGALGWQLDEAHIAKLDAASHREPTYPYWHQKGFDQRNPKPTQW